MGKELMMLHGEMYVGISKYTGNEQSLNKKLFPYSLTELLHIGKSLEEQGLPVIYGLQYRGPEKNRLMSGSYEAFNVPKAKKYVSTVQKELKENGHPVQFVKGTKNRVDKVRIGELAGASEVEIFTNHNNVHIRFESREAMGVKQMENINTIVQQSFDFLEEYL